MGKMWQMATISAGVCLMMLTTGWNGSAGVLAKVERSSRPRFSRFLRLLQGATNLQLRVQGSRHSIDLSEWKRNHPWRTLHFSIPTELYAAKVMPRPVEQPTVVVTSQVESRIVVSRSQSGNGHNRPERKEARTSAAQPLGLRIAAMAMSMLGKPYVWGGATPETGFDCSGLVEYVMGRFGIAMPRTTWQQYTTGKSVPLRLLQPGDLVFFTTYANGPTHVGIYVGNSHFVNALNSSTGVTLSNMHEEYFAKRFFGARNFAATS